VSFADSIRTCLTKYVTFSGRARRSEFWWFSLFLGLVYIVVASIDAGIGSAALEIVFILATFLPSLAVLVRRLHDTGRSGFWAFITFVPIVGGIILLVWECSNSQPGVNKYGPSPKEIGPYPGAQGIPLGA
jgi:uncharacterized membrane protein YhaH (DUF805 family)